MNNLAACQRPLGYPIDRAQSLIQNSGVGTHKFETRLRNRAGAFIRALKAAGIEGAVVEDSIREYALKVSISTDEREFGAAALYYSPKSDSFSMKTHELKDKSIAPRLEECWAAKPTSLVQSASNYDIYVDGSFINGATGYGAVVVKDAQVVDELLGGVDADEVNDTRQVAGELAAVKEALNWCLDHAVKEVSIYYDYLGIEKWATGQWKTNQPLTRAYARFVGACPIKIHWRKVDSHTGDRWNDRADALAKRGAGSIQPSVGELGTGPARSGTGDLVSDLIEKTDAWIEFLMVRGIDASFDRVYNEQFARVYIRQQEETVGTLDLYNTRKKRFSPYVHNFRDRALKLRIETLWSEFQASLS